MNTVSSDAIEQLFSKARTYHHWLAKEVTDQDCHAIYELMKWGPTSANLCPVRIVFVKSALEKEKLITCLSATNVDKVKAAPVTAIIAMDEQFYTFVEKLFPQAPHYGQIYASDKALAESTAFRNSSLQGAYFIIAARALGFDCGPMSGFDNKKLDETFFKETAWKSNFICNIGYGDKTKLHPRLPRLTFEEACKII